MQFINYKDGDIVSINGNLVKTKNDFLQDINSLNSQLPNNKYIINICENRYYFMLLFVSCVLKSKINLLPNYKTTVEIKRLKKEYIDCCTIDDIFVSKHINKIQEKSVKITNNIDKNQEVAILFTSGTTGEPKANIKKWGQLYTSAINANKRLAFESKNIVATVPPQHMFGFETTIIYPLIFGLTVHQNTPFYPLDIIQNLNDFQNNKVLVTTPIHLKACNQITQNWGEISFVLSATSSLDIATTQLTEKNMNTKVLEIYGCTEIGAIATREPTKNLNWKLLKHLQIIKNQQIKIINCNTSITIPDKLKILNDTEFKLISRNVDLVNIGGKRDSLMRINNFIQSIDGVKDSIVFIPKNLHRDRLCLLVVTKKLNKEQIIKTLKLGLNSVFMPRPIIIIDELPYNNLGKLPYYNLIQELNKHNA